MQTKKQARSSKSMANMEKQRQKFPDILLKIINTSDIILEILDARFIEETRNEEIEKLIKQKGEKIIYVLNKSDLSSRKQPKEIYPYVFVSCKTREGIRELRNRIKIESQRVKSSMGNNYKRIQVGVIGYPNSGKSSVINLLKGKTSAKVGAEAGFTKGIQKIKLTPEILLLDSPGVIPTEKYSQEDKEKMSEHAKVGARDYNKIKEPEIVISALIKEYKGVLEKFYKINANGDAETLIEELGKRMNFLKKGNEINADKTARHILKDWQEGKIRI